MGGGDHIYICSPPEDHTFGMKMKLVFPNPTRPQSHERTTLRGRDSVVGWEFKYEPSLHARGLVSYDIVSDTFAFAKLEVGNSEIEILCARAFVSSKIFKNSSKENGPRKFENLPNSKEMNPGVGVNSKIFYLFKLF